MENDTAFFKKLNRDINIDTTFLRSWAEWDSCVNIPKLSDMAVDEAYRFTHSQSFCDFGQKITISRSGNIVNLQYIEFSNGDGHASTLEKPDGSIINIPPYCVIAKQFDKILSMKEWDELVRRVYAADYWMLASKGHINSTDGSFWQIEAYSNQRIHLVKRQCGCYSVFENIGRYFLQISGEKTMCSEFF
ncbi:MAG TPA: hypothetical protein VIZ28_16560 [Chitinophagaceae bacterium]